MDEQKNEMNQNHIGDSLPQEIPIPDLNRSGAVPANPWQQTNDPYAGGQGGSPYGGQSNPYQQPVSPYGGTVHPYVPAAERRGNAVKILIGVACALLVLAALLIGALLYLRSTPAYRISRGFGNLAKEISQSKNPLTEKAGASKLLQMMREEGSHVESSFNFATDLPLLGSTTLGIDTDFYKDMHAKELNADTTLSLMNMELAHVNLYADDEVLCFSIPELFLEDMYIENENVVRQYNQSLWAELGAQSSMEDFSIDLFGDTEDRIQAREWRDLEAFGEQQFALDLDACKEGMTIAKVEKDLYRVTFPEKETDRLLRHLLDYYGKLGGSEEELQAIWKEYQNLLCSEINVLIEVRGSYIDSIVLEEPVSLWDDTASIGGELFFLGEKRSIDHMQGKVEIEGTDGSKRKLIGQLQQTYDRESQQIDVDLKYASDEEEGRIKFLMNSDAVSDEFDMTFSVRDDEEEFVIGLEGGLEDIVQGESLRLALDRVSFRRDDEELYRISGNIDIEPLRDRVRPTVQAKTAFFEMTLDDWEEIITKLDDAYGSILDSLW